MSSAMNHRWRKIENAPIPKLHIWGDGTTASWHDDDCSWTKCHGKQIIAQISYDYITGRKGRITSACKFVCQEHLDKFLKKNPSAIEIDTIQWKNYMPTCPTLKEILCNTN